MATSFNRVLMISSNAANQNEDFVATRAFKVFDVSGVVVTQAATTTTAQRQALGAGAFNAISSALSDNAAAGTISRTTTLAAAQQTFAATDVLRFAGSGAGRQACYALIKPIAS